jgi:hypothetical protein
MQTPAGFSGGSNPAGVRLAIIGEAWAVVQKNMGTWIVAALIYIAIVGVVSAVMGQIAGKSVPLSILLSLITAAIGGFLMGGALRMAFKQLRGESTSPVEIFNGSDIASATIGASVLQQVVLSIALAACILPGLFIAPLLLLVLPIATAQKTGPVESLSRSFNLLKPHWSSAFVLSLVLGLILIVSAIPCGLGLLVTWPLIIVVGAILYNDFFGGGSAFDTNTNLYPPIPNIPQ